MNPTQFSQFQSVAGQFLGGAEFHPAIKHPQTKIKPRSLETLRDVKKPSTLAALMHMEQSAHEDKTKNFHVGGGLAEGATSIFSSLWNTIGLGPEFNDWFNFFDYDSPENKISTDDQEFAKIIQESYKDVDERSDEMGDWAIDTSLSDKRFSVWVDQNDNAVHVALRGTKDLADVGSDLHILMSNTSGNEAGVYAFLKDVQDKYSDYKLDASGHSLGANELIEVFEKYDDLHYDRVNLFSPGTNPLWNLDRSKEAVSDEKFYFYLNSGDLLSNTFVSLLPSERENVYWSKPTHNPLSNHGIAQWVDTV